MELSIFKVKYTWYEGEEDWTYLGKAVTQEQFDKDIKEARDFAESLLGTKVHFTKEYLGKGYSVECLPEFYRQVIWYLTEKKGYIECNIFDNFTYYVEDAMNNRKISILKSEQKIERETL